MASTDIRKYTWYNQYIVQPQDMTGLQQYLRDSVESSLESLLGASVLSGMRVTNVGGMVLEVSEGAALSPAGRLMVLGSPAQVTLGSDPTNPRRSLVVARPKLTQVATIVDPTNPPNNVVFVERLDVELVVIPGTPAGSPSYPSAQANDTVLMGVYIPAAAVSLNSSNYEISRRQTPKVQAHRIREISASYTAASGDGEEDIIEFDATSASGVVTLPPASVMMGKCLTLMKVDSSANVVQLKGDGSETISGQTEVELDTQWQSVTIYAHKSSWRMK
jgi:hypothetical protein